MNTTKKINVNYSSLVGLKAELLRKQSEIKDAKAKQEFQPRLVKPKTKSKKVKNKEPKVDPGYTEIEDVATLKKSRVMLEAKSSLYEKLKKVGGDDRHNYLVDFANKSDESEDEVHREDEYDEVNSDPEDDWVEYEDCFGRTRKCLRRDLPKMKEKDNMIKREITKEPPQVEAVNEPAPKPETPIFVKEPEIEIMRKKWEEQMEKLLDKSDIHYQDVLFDEARAHGVGYYAFSQNEEVRAKQQESLAKLRKETERRQKESQEARDSKNNIEFKRLKAAMVRQRVRSGQSPELTQEEEETLRAQIRSRYSNETQEEETSPEAIKAAVERAKTQEKRVDNSLVVVEDKIKAFAELLGKRPKWHEMSQEEWVHKRRKDRLGEFAPVYENFRRAACPGETKARDTRITTRDNDQKDPMRINSDGPEPTDRWETDGPSYRKDIKDAEERKTEETLKDDSTLQKSGFDAAATIEEDNDENAIGPFPPCPSSNPAPASFINSFVPQPMSTEPQLPLSFEKPAPLPSIINFSIPPPPIPKSLPPLDPNIANTENIQGGCSSDSDDSDIIGPVPPPSFKEIPKPPAQYCGPRLIENECLSTLLDIPLPETVRFNERNDLAGAGTQSSGNSTNIDEKQTTNDRGVNPTGNLDVDKISAGLKYLRQKFDSTRGTANDEL